MQNKPFIGKLWYKFMSSLKFYFKYQILSKFFDLKWEKIREFFLELVKNKMIKTTQFFKFLLHFYGNKTYIVHF